MAKINLNGEWFDFDFGHKPMSEALALEDAGPWQRYADWETELEAGSVKAMAGLVWLVWRRNGRKVPLADILSGAAEVDLGPLLESLGALAEEAAGPTGPGESPGRTPTTPPGTPPSSRRSTGSARGRSGS